MAINIFTNADTTARDLYARADRMADAGSDQHLGGACSCRTCRRKANLRGTGPRVDGFDRDTVQPRNHDGQFRAIGAAE